MFEGIGQTLAMQAFAGVDALAPVEGMGPVGEFRLVPDPNTFVVLPYAPNSGLMLCDMISQHDRQPWVACPRTFLKRILFSAAQMGISVQATVEHEFYLARETPGGYESFDRSLCYSSIGFDSSAQIIDAIIAALEETPSAPAESMTTSEMPFFTRAVSVAESLAGDAATTGWGFGRPRTTISLLTAGTGSALAPWPTAWYRLSALLALK